MHHPRTSSSAGRRLRGAGLLAAALLLPAAGCDTLARSQGKFPVAVALGSTALDAASSEPKDPRLKVVDGSQTSWLVRVAYRSPWDGSLINRANGKQDWDEQSYYMVIDVTGLLLRSDLGAGTDGNAFRSRLSAVAELLLVAADWNGDVYWRHLTTFLETYKALDAAAQAAYGAAIAGAFISPVLAASLAGGGLAIDTFVGSYTSSLNIDEYAELRASVSTYREALRGEILREASAAEIGSGAVASVLQKCYDYAYSYSIKGAIHASQVQNTELTNLLVTGQSRWEQFFSNSRDEHVKQAIRDGKPLPESPHLDQLRREIQVEDDRRLRRLRESGTPAASPEAGRP